MKYIVGLSLIFLTGCLQYYPPSSHQQHCNTVKRLAESRERQTQQYQYDQRGRVSGGFAQGALQGWQTHDAGKAAYYDCMNR